MPDRQTPPLSSRSFLDTMFPVNPLEVVGGLMGLGTQAAGNAVSYMGSHTPLDALTPGGSAAPPGVQESANQLGRDVTARLDMPTDHPSTVAAVPAVAAGAKLLPEAETVASTIAKRAEPAVAAPAPPIVAYHGSPHSFDRFDISKIGTGEGTQAYGHGLYFAENEGVAKSYRDSLAQHTIDGKSVSQFLDETPKIETIYDALREVKRSNPNATIDDASKFLASSSIPSERSVADALSTYGTIENSRRMMNKNDIPILDNMVSSGRVKVNPGSMYQVGINADPSQFLDWDKPFAQQSPAVQQAINKLWTDKGGSLEGRTYPPFVASSSGDTGENIHAAIDTTYGGEPPATSFGVRVPPQQQGAGASTALRDAGVPGIKYLDQGSRDAGQGSSNYVLFNDANIDVLKKYGLAGLGVAGGAGVLSASGQSPVSSPAEAATLGQQSPAPTASSPGFDDWWQQLQNQRFSSP